MQIDDKYWDQRVIKRKNRKIISGASKESATYFELLNLLSLMPRDNLSLHQLMNALLNLILQITAMEAGAIYLKDDFSNTMELFVQEGFSQEYLNIMKTITIGRGFSGRAAQIGKVRVSQLRQGDPRFIRPASEREGFQCFICLPFRDDGFFEETLGILNMGSKKDVRLSTDTLSLLRLLSKQIGNKLANYKIFKLAAKRERWAEGLYSIAVEIQSLHDIPKICHVVSEEARLLFEADFCLVTITNKPSVPLTVAPAGCISQETACKLAAVFQENFREDLQAGSIIISGKMITKILNFSELKLEALCVVPVQIATNPCGFIALGYREPKNLTEEKKVLERLSNQLAAAIDNAQLYLRVQQLTAVKERNWIAREMHDSLAQELGAARLEIAKIKNHLENGQENKVFEGLSYLDNILKQTYNEVRQAILDLRIKTGTENIIEIIDTYLKDYSKKTGIALNSSLPSRLVLNPALEVQLVRILQEALTNVRKHSQADKVSVELKIDKGKIILTVKDNGCGFAVDKLPSNAAKFGLTVMQERAQAVGGKLYLSSEPGKGTEVRAEFPH
ncbi:GAF domain-containing sensor histidine kinase [Neomoorella humiferrea]|uniref:sensor histidine kinase n=1 Tax=Neomoorella humiferrea TaxID=676965 RepID=UPI003D94BD84